MQTRAIRLPPGLVDSPEELVETLDALGGRGYNTVVVPVLHDGSVTFRTSRGGYLKGRRCAARECLRILAGYSFSVWLSVDVLTAGRPGSGELGRLAQRNRDWLMKTSGGGYEVPSQTAPVPGLFCWTALEYRRFLGNLLVEIIEAFPIDGLLVDLRRLPKTDPGNLATWTHLGYSCLQRLESEIGMDLEKLLTQPTESEFKAAENWRHGELVHFLVNLKSRAQKPRGQLPFCLLSDLGDPREPFAPWARALAKGLVDEVALLAAPEKISATVQALDDLVDDERPFLVAIDRETHLPRYTAALAALPATGFLILRPDVENDTDIELPEAVANWPVPGGVESQSVTAALILIDELFHRMEGTDPVWIFFQELEEYLSGDPESMSYKDVMRVREDVTVVHRRIASEDYADLPNRVLILRRLDLVSRLLLLTPAPPIFT